jgi:coronin-1B/1C/6
MPKRGLSVNKCMKKLTQVHENEVMRAYKTVRDVLIEPVSFIVPRRVTYENIDKN